MSITVFFEAKGTSSNVVGLSISTNLKNTQAILNRTNNLKIDNQEGENLCIFAGELTRNTLNPCQPLSNCPSAETDLLVFGQKVNISLVLHHCLQYLFWKLKSKD